MYIYTYEVICSELPDSELRIQTNSEKCSRNKILLLILHILTAVDN